MIVKVDYYILLLRAVDRLDDNSYEQRQALYEAAQETLLKQLSAADPPHSDDEVASEQAALLTAIRRVESELEGGREAPAEPYVPPGKTSCHQETEGPGKRKRRRRILGRIAGRILIAVVTFGAGFIGYAHVTGELDLRLFANWMSDRVPSFGSAQTDADRSAPAQRAVLYEEDPADPIGRKYVGDAIWRTHLELVGPARKVEIVVTLEVEIPEKDFVLAMSVRHNSDQGTAISHLVEFRFARPKRLPFEAISNVLGILMKKEERSAGVELAGRVVNVTSDVFLLGLSGADDDRQRNLRLLREGNWLDIPVLYKDGSRSILAVEKGAAGERAISQALRKWEEK